MTARAVVTQENAPRSLRSSRLLSFSVQLAAAGSGSYRAIYTPLACPRCRRGTRHPHTDQPVLLFALSLLIPQSVPAPLVAAESLAVEVSGSGEPVVMIPGLFGSAHAYRQLVRMLTENGYQAITIEPLGIGASARLKDADYSLTAQADRIAKVLDTLEVRKAVLVAHSVGGSITLRLAYRRPDLVRAVISLEGGPAEAATTSAFRRWLAFAPLGKLFNAEAIMQKMVYRDLVRSSADTAWITEELVRNYLAGDMVDFDATLDAYRGMARSEEPEMLRDRLGEIEAPVWLLIGCAKHKGGPSPEESALLDSLVPVLVIDSIPRAGHFIHEERPEAVLSAVVRATKTVSRKQ